MTTYIKYNYLLNFMSSESSSRLFKSVFRWRIPCFIPWQSSVLQSLLLQSKLNLLVISWTSFRLRSLICLQLRLFGLEFLAFSHFLIASIQILIAFHLVHWDIWSTSQHIWWIDLHHQFSRPNLLIFNQFFDHSLSHQFL